MGRKHKPPNQIRLPLVVIIIIAIVTNVCVSICLSVYFVLIQRLTQVTVQACFMSCCAGTQKASKSLLSYQAHKALNLY